MKKALVFLFSLALIVVACNKEKDPATLGVSVGSVSGAVVVGDTIKVNQTGGSASLSVTSNVAWTIAGVPTWCTASQTSGNGNIMVTFSASTNTAFNSRQATVTFSAADVNPVTFILKQAGIQTMLNVTGNTDIMQEGNDGDPLLLQVESNLRWTVSVDAASTWCTLGSSAGTYNGMVDVTAQPNYTPALRAATLTFIGKDADGVQQMTKDIEVIQFGETPTFIEIDPVAIDGSAQTITVPVRTNLEYTVAIQPAGSWLTVISNSKKATISYADWDLLLDATANTTDAWRAATVTLSAGTTTTAFTVTQRTYNEYEAEKDSVALLKFYDISSAKSAWDVADSWSFGDPIATWPGVTVDPATNRITKLVLPQSSGKYIDVTSTFFPVLSKLESLTIRVRTASNDCFKAIDSVCLNTSLKELTIQATPSQSGVYPNYTPNNVLPDGLPAAIGNLTNLERLVVDGLSGLGAILNKKPLPVEIGRLTKLKVLKLPTAGVGETALPAEIQNLILLDTLVLDKNYISAIGDNFGKLSALTYFSMKGNKVSGCAMPASYSNLTNLKYMDMSAGSITGSIPTAIGSMTALEVLNLESNQMNGALPDGFSSLTKLKQLYLKGNQFSGTYPTAMGAFSLDTVTLSNNKFTAIAAGSVKSPCAYDFSSNPITTQLPGDIAKYAKELNFTGCSLTAAMFPSQFEAPVTKKLVVNTNKLGTWPAAIATLSSAETITAQTCGLTNPATVAISGLSNLKELNVANNNITSFTLSGSPLFTTLIIQQNLLTSINLSGLTSLQSLNLNGNRLTTVDLTGLTALKSLEINGAPSNNNNLTSLSLVGLSNLEILNINGHKSLTTIDGLSTLAKLKTVTLNNNGLTSVDLRASANTLSATVQLQTNALTSAMFGTMPNVAGLNMSANSFTTISLPAIGTASTSTDITMNAGGNPLLTTVAFGDLSAVTNLDLSNTPQIISLTIPAMPKVKTINLSRTIAARGQLATLVMPASQPALTTLNLSYNALTEIPANVFNYTLVSQLNVSFNKLTSFPSGLQTMTGLRLLYLQNNEMIGTLPDIFDSFTGMTMCNVSNNKLTGTAPKSIYDPTVTPVVKKSYYTTANFNPQTAPGSNFVMP